MLRHRRRHIQGCKSGASCKKCPYWVDGRHGGKRIHRSLGTADFQTAAQLVQHFLLTGKFDPEPEAVGITIADAVRVPVLG